MNAGLLADARQQEAELEAALKAKQVTSQRPPGTAMLEDERA